MVEVATKPDPYASLRLPEVRALILATAFGSLGSRALAVVIGYQVYAITHDPLKLGLLGLVEAIPSVGLALYGGHVADRLDRRRIVLITGLVTIFCALAFAFLSLGHTPSVNALFAIVFIAGIARGFSSPAGSALEGQVVPQEVYVNASAWNSSVWQTCAIVGPTLAGFGYAVIGPANIYFIVAVLATISWFCMRTIRPRPVPPATEGESIWTSIKVGLRFVLRSQALGGSMALDLFAVFFGGAVALFPVFATDILHTGPQGVGLLNSATSIGALLVMLWATHHPPVKHAGRNLIWCVAGFGVCMIVFGLSRNFWVSMVAMFAAGAFDGVSMVIRGAILRLMTPENLRGRVSSVNWVFIGSSNEFGAMESGAAAKWLGTARSVWMGGILTLVVVAAAFGMAPKLRTLSLDPPPPLDPEPAS